MTNVTPAERKLHHSKFYNFSFQEVPVAHLSHKAGFPKNYKKKILTRKTRTSINTKFSKKQGGREEQVPPPPFPDWIRKNCFKKKH